ncbi:MAG: SprB repeat-containing protein [Ferruginibacter sp.]
MKKAFFVLFSLFISLASFAFGVIAVVSPASCPNLHNGTITVTPAGGVAPYTYMLNPGGSISLLNTFSGLAPGSYTITVIDAMGDNGSTTISVFAAGVITSTSINSFTCSNQLPYHFGGMNIFNSGTYTDTLTNMTGCDSIVTLNLSIIQQQNSSTNISICTSQIPYLWNGQNYSSSGVYTKTFVGSSGCDSTATPILNVSNTNEWTGTVSTSWEEPSNWSCGVVPGQTTDVVINSGTVVIHISTAINSLSIAATVNLTVNPGVNLTVLH